MAANSWAEPNETFVEPENEKHKQWHAKALDAFIEIANLFETDAWKSKDAKEWKYEGDSKTTGDKVYSKTMYNNKAFVLTGEIEATLDEVERLSWSEVEDTPKWCKAVTEYKVLAKIGSHADVIYGVSAPAVGGLVAARDVITSRIRRRNAQYFMQGGQSVEVDTMPQQKGKVRACDFPFVMRFTVMADKPGYLQFDWMSNTDIKGWLPGKVVQQFFSESMHDYMASMRAKINADKKQ